MARAVQYTGSLPRELLTLSACDTAAGDDRAAVGVAGIAIQAGARSAVATQVHDQVAADLVAAFSCATGATGIPASCRRS